MINVHVKYFSKRIFDALGGYTTFINFSRFFRSYELRKSKSKRR